MMTLTEIETAAQFMGRNIRLSLTDSEGLPLANRMLRRLAAALPWPEYRVVDTSLTTVKDQENYVWPADLRQLDLRLVEIQDAGDNDKYKPIMEAPSEYEWNLARREPARSVPAFYLRQRSGPTDELLLAPVPSFGSQIVRLTFYREPEPLVDGDSPTAFIQRSADDALAYLCAAEWEDHDKGNGAGDHSRSSAGRILSDLFGRAVTPDELK